ncbi:hypothetical protein [Lysinibacillus sp. TE18511]
MDSNDLIIADNKSVCLKVFTSKFNPFKINKRLFIYFHSANVFVAKAKRQLQKTPTSGGGEMEADVVSFQWVSKRLLKIKPRLMSRILKGMNCACTIQNPDAITPRRN